MKTYEKTITATEFKAKCLRILDNLEPGGILVTKRGKPVARVIPAGAVTREDIIGSMQGDIRVKGDILSTGLPWNAQS